MKPSMIRDASLAVEGRQKIDWVIRHMPLLRQLSGKKGWLTGDRTAPGFKNSGMPQQ